MKRTKIGACTQNRHRKKGGLLKSVFIVLFVFITVFTVSSCDIFESSSGSSVKSESGISSGELRSEFKAAMDSYETVMNEYVSFMKKYKANPNDMNLLADYATYMSKYAEAVDKFNKWESNDLNAAETSYYIEVQARVSKKLLEVAQ